MLVSAYEDLIVMLSFRQGLQSVASRHSEECRCVVCRAWQGGDGPALAEAARAARIKLPAPEPQVGPPLSFRGRGGMSRPATSAPTGAELPG